MQTLVQKTFVGILSTAIAQGVVKYFGLGDWVAEMIGLMHAEEKYWAVSLIISATVALLCIWLWTKFSSSAPSEENQPTVENNRSTVVNTGDNAFINTGNIENSFNPTINYSAQIAPKPAARKLTDDLKTTLLTRLNRDFDTKLSWAGQDPEAENFAQEIKSFLQENGYVITNSISIGLSVPPMKNGQRAFIKDNKNHVEIGPHQ